MTDAQRQVTALATLLQLEKTFRNIDMALALAYTLVNDSRVLVEYRQAVLWQINSSDIIAVSGQAVIDPQAPYIVWLTQVCKQLSVNPSTTILPLTVDAIEGYCAKEWPQWWSPHALWVPVSAYGAPPQAALLLVRETAWTEGECYLLEHVADSFGHAWLALSPKPPFWKRNWLSEKIGKSVV